MFIISFWKLITSILLVWAIIKGLLGSENNKNYWFWGTKQVKLAKPVKWIKNSRLPIIKIRVYGKLVSLRT